LDSGVLRSNVVRESSLIVKAIAKEGLQVRRGWQQSGWTPSAHLRPWNPTRASIEFSGNAPTPALVQSDGNGFAFW